MESFPNWLLKELKDRDMSQSDLARLANLGSGTISNIMNGSRKVGQDTLTKIAQALRLPPELVFEKAGVLPPKTELPPKHRELMEKLKTASEADVQFVIDMLEVSVKNRQRQVPNNINPKTTPR